MRGRTGASGKLDQRLQDLEALIGEVQAIGDEDARRTAVDAIQALLQLHGDGLERILDLLRASGEPAQQVVARLAADTVVGGLLLLHGLHPVGQEQRVRAALDRVRPHLAAQDADVELLSIADGAVRLRLLSSRSGDSPAALPLRYLLEQAVLEAAPDVSGIEVEHRTPGKSEFVPLQGGRSAAAAAWRPVPQLVAARADEVVVVEVGGAAVAICRVGASWHGYTDSCPGCGSSLAGATFDGALLACPGCDRRYDVGRAGQCREAADLCLAEVPILIDAGLVQVAAG